MRSFVPAMPVTTTPATTSSSSTASWMGSSCQGVRRGGDEPVVARMQVVMEDQPVEDHAQVAVEPRALLQGLGSPVERVRPTGEEASRRLRVGLALAATLGEPGGERADEVRIGARRVGERGQRHKRSGDEWEPDGCTSWRSRRDRDPSAPG
jgi:hypothetical protein